MTESSPEKIVISSKRKLVAFAASTTTFLLVAISCWFIFYATIYTLGIRITIGTPIAGLVFFSIATTSLICGYFVHQKIAGKEYSRSVFFFTGRVLRAIAVWGISFLGMTLLSDFGQASWPLKWIAFGTFNVPVLITLIRSYRLTKKQWDWCFLTFLILHANIVIALMFSKTWTPDVHFVRGLIFGQTLILVSLGICFLYRAVKGQMSIPRFVQYGLGGFAPTIVFFIVREHWVYSSYYV